jgi:hypothetical protein
VLVDKRRERSRGNGPHAHDSKWPRFSWGHVNPIGIRACYDEGKRVAETLTYGFQRQDGVDVRVARIFK